MSIATGEGDEIAWVVWIVRLPGPGHTRPAAGRADGGSASSARDGSRLPPPGELKYREVRRKLFPERGRIGSSPVKMNADREQSTRTGSVVGGFAFALGLGGLYFALQLWILPAAGIPT